MARAAREKVIVVCGPTASGKSRLADELASRLTEATGSWATTVVVDSMQVYRELPIISNQARERPAALVGEASVADEWTVARHRLAAHRIIRKNDGPFVLDAGTGMYLNAVLLDLKLAPKVEPATRRRAERRVMGSCGLHQNARRAVRQEELRLAGASDRGSIWDGDLLFDVALIYLRPSLSRLEEPIAIRSGEIARRGLDEARLLDEMERAEDPPNPSVRTSIAVRELREHLAGAIPLDEAERRINTRTRRLARRQIRWFDKLAGVLDGRANVIVAETAADQRLSYMLHDIIEESVVGGG